MNDNIRKIVNIIIAIVVSIGAWTFVVYNNDPMTEVRYREIPITFKGEDALANKGLGVSQVSTELIDVTLRQRRIDTGEISAENITVIADVSEAEEGENGISLKISGPEGTQVAEAERRSISVEVEEADSKQLPITVEYDGSLAGYEPVTEEITSHNATVIGAASEIERVDSIAALVGLDETGDRLKNFTRALSALDEDGAVIEHVVIYPGEVNFYAYTGITKDVPLKVIQTESGSKDDGYERSYTAPQSVTIKGSEAIIENVTEISTVPVNIAGMYTDEEVTLECDLPSGVYLSNDTGDLVMKVKVTRKPEENTDDQ
jgi:YbbR domain-containing protein